jgi:hypothetical protein
MDETVITVEARVAGQRKPLVAGRKVALAMPPAGGSGGEALRLRDVLTQVVQQEVRAFTQRQEERRLVRVLSPDEIDRAAASGKIAMGGVEDRSTGAPVSEETAVAVALQAFTDGLYFVFLDGRQQEDLDAAVVLRPASTLTFIRLVALAGG